MIIDFIEYILPNGRQRPAQFVVSDEIGEMAREIENDGERRFECETLSTGQISLTICGENEDGDQGDLDIEIAEKGLVDVALPRLITRFHAQMTEAAAS